MHKISEITEFSKAKIRILFEDETFLTVYKGMYKGDREEMSDEDFEALQKEILSYCKKRAMNLLIKKDYSRKALEKKLEGDGYDPGTIEKTMEFLDSYHYLDDLRIAENLIRNHRALKSRAEIGFLLKNKDIPDEIADQAMENVYYGDEGEERDTEMKAVIAVLKKKGLTPEKIGAMEFNERQKLAASLFRKGFKGENIIKALKIESFD